MKKGRVKINLLLGILLGVVLAIMLYCLVDIYLSIKSSGAKEVEILDRIEGYGYKLDENDSSYFEKLFKELKDNLEKEEIDEELYAKQLAKLFITDFYSLDYAMNKNDVGGVQFVYKDYQDTFILKAKDTIYKYVENNLYGKREQELPVVENVEINNVLQEKRAYDLISDDDAYIVTVGLTYEKDLGYPTECNLVFVHNNNVLELVSME